MRRSVELALEHLGGKIAGKPVEIVYEDDQFKPDVGKARSEKLRPAGQGRTSSPATSGRTCCWPR